MAEQNRMYHEEGARDEEERWRPRREAEEVRADTRPRNTGEGPRVSAATQRLVQAWRDYGKLDMAKEDITACDARRMRKRQHWAWYVWPTSWEGQSDKYCTAVQTGEDVKYLIKHASEVNSWASILEELAQILQVQHKDRRRSIYGVAFKP